MHTPLPWQLNLGIAAPEIMGNSRRIAIVLYHDGSEDNEVYDNARLIVRACNSHAVLLEALESAHHLRFIDDTSTHEEQMEFWTKVEQLIEKAKGDK
jgi:hypothetical protein